MLIKVVCKTPKEILDHLTCLSAAWTLSAVLISSPTYFILNDSQLVWGIKRTFKGSGTWELFHMFNLSNKGHASPHRFWNKLQVLLLFLDIQFTTNASMIMGRSKNMPEKLSPLREGTSSSRSMEFGFQRYQDCTSSRTWGSAVQLSAWRIWALSSMGEFDYSFGYHLCIVCSCHLYIHVSFHPLDSRHSVASINSAFASHVIICTTVKVNVVSESNWKVAFEITS